jgi:glucokinase
VILAADIGGTNARVALFEPHELAPAVSRTYRTDAWDGVEEIVGDFLERRPARVAAACVAVAGPVRHGRSDRVNLLWSVDRDRLARVLDVDAVSVVNDLEANARGVALMRPEDLAVVNRGDASSVGNRVVVSAGTGLGEASLYWDGTRYHAVAGEGGHSDFAPRSETEVGLYRFLAAEYGHVSYERVCSGGGLVNIDRFLQATDGCDAPSSRSAAAITAEAAADPESRGGRALTLFCSIYGARAANVALGFMATGGVYLGGGIAPRIVGKLAGGSFMHAFTAKGRMADLLAQMPVHVVLNDQAALLGAAAIGRDLVD